MSTDKSTNPVDLRDVQREHTMLNELQTELSRVLVERHEPISRITSLLERIRECVHAHLDDEAYGVIHQCAVGDTEHRQRCQNLCDDHEQLRTQLADILEMSAQFEDSPAQWSNLETSFRAFSTALTEHERREQALIQDIEKRKAPSSA